MTKYSYLSKPKAKKKVSQKKISLKKLDIKKLNVVFGVLVFSLAVGGLIQANGLATKGYQIKELESQVEDLKQVKADLELEALSLQSMGSVKEKIAGLGMVEIHETSYVDTSSAVAFR